MPTRVPWEVAVLEDHFASVLLRQYAALTASGRKQRIRELVSESQENEKSIRKHFPKGLAKAFAKDPARGCGAAL